VHSVCERNWSNLCHIHSRKSNKLLFVKLEDLVYVCSNLQLAINNVVTYLSNFSTPWFDLVLDALGDQDDLHLECDRMSSESNGDRASNGFTVLSGHDDVELFYVTSGPEEYKE
jgi:hypothetical protein